MKNTDDKNVCSAARCSCRAALIYLGTPLCDRHWLQLCETDNEETSNGQDPEDS